MEDPNLLVIAHKRIRHPSAAAVLIIVFGLSVGAAATPPQSSNTLLLHPAIHQGQTFDWDLRIPDPNAPHFKQWRTDIFTCNVLKKTSGTFSVSRRVKVYLPAFQAHTASDPSRTVGKVRPASIYLLSKPSITIQNGHEFKEDGRPLRNDPICLFYSVPMFGQPPSRLAVGESWNFDRNFSGWCSACTGTTTVEALNIVGGIVRLRSKMSYGGKGKVDELIDMTVIDGGVVTVMTERWPAYKPPLVSQVTTRVITH